MFRMYFPGASLLALAVAAILKLIPGKNKKRKQAQVAPSCHSDDSSYGSAVRAKEEQPYMSIMQRIVDEHADYTAEVFQLFVSGRRKAGIISRLIPGDRVALKLICDDVWVTVNGREIEYSVLPDDSRLPQILTEHIHYDAYLGGREVQVCTPTLEVVSIIVFYKIDGVPPTNVDLR